MVDEDKEFTPEVEQESIMADSLPDDGGSAADKAPKKRSTGAWIGYGALALVLILVAAGVFLLHELRSKQEGLGTGLDKGDRQMQELLHQISTLQAEVATVNQQLATVQSAVTKEESKFEREIGEEGSTFKNELDAVRTDLGNAIQHIQQHMNQSRGDIMVADAEYLLSVANQKLHLVGDVKAVIAMMEAADQRLHDSGDPAAFKVREALAEELEVLKDFNPPDVVGVSAKILVLEGQVKDLPLFLPHSERAKENHTPVASSIPDTTKKSDSLADSMVDDLKDLVTIRHTDRPVQAILLPEEVVALRQVLLLKLEMARSALLRGDDTLYKANMDSALAWLKENFDPAAALTQSLAGDIESLRGLQLQVPLPDISKSLGLLRNIEKLRVDSDKGQPGKPDKSNKAVKAPAPPVAEPAPPPLTPPSQPEQQPPASQQPGEAGGPVMEPQPEEGAKP
ncbi:MAG: uroporphyrinogen-III C-methyltransferase [Proteobacteria bacterium]|nr:uroporphyrinogen-III C-methyltransferase [Pseudomonadota bacterium]